MVKYIRNIAGVITIHDMFRRDLFYLLDYVTRRSKKLRFVKKKKMVLRQIVNKFPNIGILFLCYKKNYDANLSHS